MRWTTMTAAALTALAFLQAGQSSARTRKTKPKPHCALRRGWKVVAEDSQAVVITGQVTVLQPDGTTLPEQQWRFCLRKTGGFQTLVTDMGAVGGYADIFGVGDVLLSGIHVAYASTDELGGGRYGITGGVDVTNLLTGNSVNGVVLGNFAQGLILAPPIAAWEANNAPYSWAVQALDARTGKTTTLDSVCSFPGCIEPGPAPPQSPFANLQLQRCLAGCSPIQAIFAWWTDNGVWRSTRVRYRQLAATCWRPTPIRASPRTSSSPSRAARALT